MASKIGQRIEKLRLKMAMSQTEFGNRFGMSAMSISRWERGENLPDARALLTLGVMAKQQSMDVWVFWNQAGLTRKDARSVLAREKAQAAAGGR